MKRISFNSPSIINKNGNSINFIRKMKSFSGGGVFTEKCSKWLKKNIQCKEALLTHSCTAALEMCALLLEIKKDDEIIMPSFTFVSTANAFVARGGKPIFVDVDKNTFNIDPSKIEQCISKKTKAIVVVHYAGISCDMDLILKIAKKYKLYIIEDGAQAILSKYKGKPLGSIGDLATISFHETKNIHCGEGGALLINNVKFLKRAKIIRDKGTNRDLFNQNIVKKYTWLDYGSNYALSEISASILYSQLKNAKKITEKRIKIYKLYNKLLKNLELNGFIKRPIIPKFSTHNAHIYPILVKKASRNMLIDHLKKKKIHSVFHYIPLHNSPFGKKKSNTKSILKVTNDISASLLRLPLHINLKKKDVLRCTKELSNYYLK